MIYKCAGRAYTVQTNSCLGSSQTGLPRIYDDHTLLDTRRVAKPSLQFKTVIFPSLELSLLRVPSS